MEEDVKDMLNEVSTLLTDHNIKHEIFGRSKSIYSIYKKLDKGKKFNDIYDILALRYLVNGENIFEAMEITYLGPIDGHSINDLIDIFTRAKDCKGPVIIHTYTKKGKGLSDAENNPELFHGVSVKKTSNSNKISFTKVFSDTLCELAE